MAIIDTYRGNVNRKREQISKLSSDKAKENAKIVAAKVKIERASDAIKRTKSVSTVKTKTNEINRAEKDITVSEKKISEIEQKIAKLEKELVAEQKKVEREEQKIHDQQIKEKLEIQKKTQREISELNRVVKLHSEIQSGLQNQIDELQRLPKTITVLFLASNPIDTSCLRLDVECREIQEMIRKSEFRDTIKFESRWAVRTSDLLQAINEVNPDVVHFSGHGDIDGTLAFENPDGECKSVTKEAMAQAIMTLSDKIRLMFFNACFSAAQAEKIVEYVDVSIGMNDTIGDEAARIFASQFYSSVGFGKNIQVAFNQAKAALMLEGIPEENTPKLFIRDGLQADSIFLVQTE